jgi:hypothetical protein
MKKQRLSPETKMDWTKGLPKYETASKFAEICGGDAKADFTIRDAFYAPATNLGNLLGDVLHRFSFSLVRIVFDYTHEEDIFRHIEGLLFGLNLCQIDLKKAFIILKKLVELKEATVCEDLFLPVPTEKQRARAISLLGQCHFWGWGTPEERMPGITTWCIRGSMALPPRLFGLVYPRRHQELTGQSIDRKLADMKEPEQKAVIDEALADPQFLFGPDAADPDPYTAVSACLCN